MENVEKSISGLQREKFQKNIDGKLTDLFFYIMQPAMKLQSPITVVQL